MTEELAVPVETTKEPEPTQEKPEQTTAEKVELSKAEFEKMQAALKEANKEAASRRKRLEELEAAENKRKEAEMTEAERTAKRIQELEAETNRYKRTELQRKVAESVGLPTTLANRLMGETEDDMIADAKALLETLPKPTNKPGINTTNPGDKGDIEETREQKKQRLFGQKTNIFEGGGVLWHDKE